MLLFNSLSSIIQAFFCVSEIFVFVFKPIFLSLYILVVNADFLLLGVVFRVEESIIIYALFVAKLFQRC